MAVVAPSFFQSLAADDVERMLGPLERLRFPAGTTVLREGERPSVMYVIVAGICEVSVVDRFGVDRRVGQIGPGATIGEMALFAGQLDAVNTAPATVRAASDLEVVALDAPGFYQLAAAFPQVLHNIGAILSQRLTRSYEHVRAVEHGRATVLLDHGAPPLLGYALAGSMAWHSRRPTLLVVVAEENEVPTDLRSLTASGENGAPGMPADGGGGSLVPEPGPGRPGARLLLAAPREAFAPAALAGTIDELCHHYDHVLVQVRADAPPLLDARELRLAGPATPLPEPSLPRPGHTIRAWSHTPALPRPDRRGELHVPPLETADEQALREGLLPARTPAGKALGWAARDLCGLKVGLALGAGSAKGYAHYGVLRALERIGLQADYVTGTSIGAIIAATYALGHTADEAARTMEETSVRAFRLTVPVHSLLSNAGVHANFRQVSGDLRIEDLDLPLALVAADIMTGREVIFRRGLLRTAALASMAIPGVYPPLRMGPYVLVDGGIVNPVPINVAADMGADIVVAVSIGRSGSPTTSDVEAEESSGRLPTLLQTIARSVEVMQGRIAAQSTAGAAATVLIEPTFASIPPVGLQSFHQGRPYIAAGEAAAEAALPRLAASLPWLRD